MMNGLFRWLTCHFLPRQGFGRPAAYALLLLPLLAACGTPRVAFRFRPVLGAPVALAPTDTATVWRASPPLVQQAAPAAPVRDGRAGIGAAQHPRRLQSLHRPKPADRLAARAAIKLTAPLRSGGRASTGAGNTNHALLLLLGGVLLGIGGLLLGGYLGGFFGGLVGVASVLAGLIAVVFSLPLAIMHPNEQKQPFTALTLLGYLLAGLGLVSVLGVPIALFAAPGSALLCLGAGLIIAVWGWVP